MAQQDRRKTVRQDADLKTEKAGALQPSRRQFTSRGNDQAIRQAEALQNAFSVGTETVTGVLERRAKKAGLAGTQAALEGRELTPEEEAKDSFMIGHNRVTVKADMVEAEASLAAEWSKLDTSNMSAADAQKWVAGQLEGMYGGLDIENDMDVATLKLIQPWVEEVELAYAEEFQSQQQELVQGELDAGFKVLIRDRLIDNDPENPYSMQDLNDEMFPIYKKDSNAELVQAVASYAIEYGDPTPLYELQKTQYWTGGAVAPGGDPEFDSIIQSAVAQAESRAITIGDREERQAAKQQKKVDDSLRIEEMAKIIDPDQDWSASTRATELIKLGISPSALESLYRFNETVREDQIESDNVDPDYAGVLAMEIALLTGYSTTTVDGKEVRTTIEDPLTFILQFSDTAAAGTGDAKLKTISGLLKMAGTISKERFTNPQYRNIASQVLTRYPVGREIATNKPDVNDQALQTAAVKMYNELVEGGMDYQKAADEVFKNYPPPVKAIGPALTLSQKTSAVSDFADGIISQAEFQASVGSDAPKVIREIMASGNVELAERAIAVLEGETS